MKHMKSIVLVSVIVLGLFLNSTFVFASEKATKEECIAKVISAVKLVEDLGSEDALEKVQDGGEFVWKDSYVFALDAKTGKIIVNPLQPKHIGKVLTAIKDVKGKMFFAEFLKVGNEKGDGWVEYWWPKPGEKTVSHKTTYIKKVPEHDILFGAGVYK